MDDKDLEIKSIQNKIGDKMYNKFMRFFKGVAKNTKEALKDSAIYITKESLEKKLRIYFGHRCDFLSSRFYIYLSNNTPAKRIYFKDFVEKLYATLYSPVIRD
jgi:hypothetical protein